MKLREFIKTLQELGEEVMDLPVCIPIEYDSDDGPYDFRQEINKVKLTEGMYALEKQSHSGEINDDGKFILIDFE